MLPRNTRRRWRPNPPSSRSARLWLIVIVALLAPLVIAAPSSGQTGGSVTPEPNAAQWAESAMINTDSVTHCIVEDAVKNIIYLCHYRGMFRSLDGGITWERAGKFDVNPADGGLVRNHYFTADLDSQGRVFVGNFGGSSFDPDRTGQVRMSDDAGETWRTITPPSLHAANLGIDSRVRDLVVDTTNPDPAKKDLVYYCAGNRVYRSLDTAHVDHPQWALDQNGNPAASQPDIKWQAITPNGSSTWPAGGLGPVSNQVNCERLVLHQGALYLATSHGIWRSDNYDEPLPVGPPNSSAIAWTHITAGLGLENAGVDDITMAADGTLYASTKHGSTADHGLWSTTDPASASPTWGRLHGRTAVQLFQTSSGALISSRRHGAGHLQFWLDRASTPGVPPTIAGEMQDAWVEDFTQLADGTLVAATYRMGVIRSTDDGLSWQQSNDGLHFFQMPRTIDNGGRVYTTGPTGLLHSDDDGLSFSHCGRWPGGPGFVREARSTGVALGPTGDIYASVSHPSGMNGLWKSTDRCATWTKQSSTLALGGAGSLVVANDGTIVAEWGNNLYRSTDDGVTWLDITHLLNNPVNESGQPGPHPIQDMQLAPDGALWMHADFDEVYRSTDNGQSWLGPISLPQIKPLPGQSAGQMIAFAANGDAFVASQWGVYVIRAGLSVAEPTGLDGARSTVYGMSSVAADSAGTLYATSANTRDLSLLGVYVSQDGGASWVHETNSIDDRFGLTVWVNPQTRTAMLGSWGEGIHRRPAPVNTRPALLNWNPNDGHWEAHAPGGDVLAEVHHGTGDAIALVGDVDGDQQDDFLNFRPGHASWSAVDAGGATLATNMAFGNPDSHNHPLVGDVDGNGHDDLVLWDESVGRFFAANIDGTSIVGNVALGSEGQTPLVGDTNGDGRDDFIIWDPSTGKWYVVDSDGTTETTSGLRWGVPGDIPLIGDTNGDGRDDFIVWRPGSGRWYSRSADGTVLVNFQQWGRYFDVPLVGDIDDDGRDDFIVWRPHNQRWFAKSPDGTVLLNNLVEGPGSGTPLFADLRQ